MIIYFYTRNTFKTAKYYYFYKSNWSKILESKKRNWPGRLTKTMGTIEGYTVKKPEQALRAWFFSK